MFNCPFKVLGETYTALMGLTWADVQLTLYRWAQYIGVVELFGPFWEVVNGFYEEHKASLDWVFPRGPGLQGLWNVARNTNLHLGTGVSVGVLASILILLYILSRFLPSKLKSLCYVLMAMGTSASIWALQSVSDTMITKLVPYWHYVLGYVVTMGLLSAAVVYRYGKITDTRTLNLIQWLLQCIGLILIYNGSQIREVSVALIIVTLMVYNFPRLWLARYFNNQSSRNLWYRFFPPKIQLLTEEEYIQQGNIHTQAELEKLRDYCRSPDCKAWKVISRLNSPHKFADFIANDAWHISEQEANWYTQDSNSDPTDSDNYSDAESELTFILGNPNMRVTLS